MEDESFDALEPEEAVFWDLPISRRYYDKVAEVLVPTSRNIQLAVLCLPSFDPEWLVCITVKGRMSPEYSLHLREATERIWMNSKPASDIHIISLEVPAGPDFVDALRHIWKLMLREARRPPESEDGTMRIGLDGVNYHFMLWHQGTLNGKTWSPDENSKCGQLVTIGESLRHYMKVEESKQTAAMNVVLGQVANLKRRFS